MSTFSQYVLTEEFSKFISSISEENLVGILNSLKKRVSIMLKEDANAESSMKILKLVTIFEQFFRFVKSKKIDPRDLVGFNKLINDSNLDHAQEEAVEKSIERIMDAFNENSFLNFKHIVEKRFKDFQAWFFGKEKEDLKILSDAIDFTLQSIHDYQHSMFNAK